MLRQSACAVGHLKVVLLECCSFFGFSVLTTGGKKHQLCSSCKPLHVSSSRLKYGHWFINMITAFCILLHIDCFFSQLKLNADIIYLLWMSGCGFFELQFCDTVHIHLPVNSAFLIFQCAVESGGKKARSQEAEVAN